MIFIIRYQLPIDSWVHIAEGFHVAAPGFDLVDSEVQIIF